MQKILYFKVWVTDRQTTFRLTDKVTLFIYGVYRRTWNVPPPSPMFCRVTRWSRTGCAWLTTFCSTTGSTGRWKCTDLTKPHRSVDPERIYGVLLVNQLFGIWNMIIYLFYWLYYAWYLKYKLMPFTRTGFGSKIGLYRISGRISGLFWYPVSGRISGFNCRISGWPDNRISGRISG